MGQYYLIVNPDKRQYLHPHNFGCGLKLMEWVGSWHGPQDALCLLLAHANGRGGGDLHLSEGDDPKGLVGSWAGDPVVVAGDYDDPGLFVPPDLYEDGTETLYSVAQEHFEDVGDDVMRLVARSEGRHYGHPWAAVDLAEGGWRSVPEYGVLPANDPALPPDREAWEAYQKTATTPLDAAVKHLELLLVRQGKTLEQWVVARADAAADSLSNGLLTAVLDALRENKRGSFRANREQLADLLLDMDDPRADKVRSKRTAAGVLALFSAATPAGG